MKTTPSRMPRRVGALLLAAGLALAGAATAGQWKWRDKAGQMHVSDLPPPHEVPEKDILQRPSTPRLTTQAAEAASAAAAAASAAPAASTPGDNKLAAEVEARKAKAQQEEKAKRQAAEASAAATRVDNCQRAKQQLALLDSGQRMARMNAKGEREVLDDKARAEESQRARGIVASDCAR
jgi:hypothetical protein